MCPTILVCTLVTFLWRNWFPSKIRILSKTFTQLSSTTLLLQWILFPGAESLLIPSSTTWPPSIGFSSTSTTSKIWATIQKSFFRILMLWLWKGVVFFKNSSNTAMTQPLAILSIKYTATFFRQSIRNTTIHRHNSWGKIQKEEGSLPTISISLSMNSLESF